jgi:hypothetical protein
MFADLLANASALIPSSLLASIESGGRDAPQCPWL